MTTPPKPTWAAAAAATRGAGKINDIVWNQSTSRRYHEQKKSRESFWKGLRTCFKQLKTNRERKQTATERQGFTGVHFSATEPNVEIREMLEWKWKRRNIFTKSVTQKDEKTTRSAEEHLSPHRVLCTSFGAVQLVIVISISVSLSKSFLSLSFRTLSQYQ